MILAVRNLAAYLTFFDTCQYGCVSFSLNVSLALVYKIGFGPKYFWSYDNY